MRLLVSDWLSNEFYHPGATLAAQGLDPCLIDTDGRWLMVARLRQYSKNIIFFVHVRFTTSSFYLSGFIPSSSSQIWKTVSKFPRPFLKVAEVAELHLVQRFTLHDTVLSPSCYKPFFRRAIELHNPQGTSFLLDTLPKMTTFHKPRPF